MGKKNYDITKRLKFLAQKFNVFDQEDEYDDEISSFVDAGYDYTSDIKDPLTENVIAIYSDKEKSNGRFKRKISISLWVFSSMIAADPTDNKIFLQWMLTVYYNLIKSDDIESAIRFACEDLPRAKEYLELFEANKRKDSFKHFCENNYNLRNISDYSDINSYKSLSLLFDAVDPFIEKDVSGIKSMIMRFVNMNEAELVFKNRNYMVYVPKTRRASTIFERFTSWCTSVAGNGMFSSYTDRLRPNGEKSKLYIIIPEKFLSGKSDAIYQIHFESNQFMDKSNRSVSGMGILSGDKELFRFFENELVVIFESMSTILTTDTYFKWANRFNMGYIILKMMGSDIISLRLLDKSLDKITSEINRFKDLKHLALINCNIHSFTTDISNLKNLEIISLNENPITELPFGLANLKKLKFLSISKTKITNLPEEIKYLDISNGGSLEFISIDNHDLYKDIRRYLPNTNIIIDKQLIKNEKIQLN
jgi:hypothetical protein